MLVLSSKKIITSILLIIITTIFLIVITLKKYTLNLQNFSVDFENTLFWGLVVIIAQIFIMLNLFIYHSKIINNMQRITTIGELSHPKVRKLLNSMGKFGLELENMLREQNRLVEIRSNRISALNSLSKILCSGFNKSIVITDINGYVFATSAFFKDRLEKADNEKTVQIDTILEIRPDISIKKVLSYMDLQKTSWSDPEFKGVICTPIVDKDNKITFCLWELESGTFNRIKLEKKTQNTKEFVSNIKRRFNWIKSNKATQG